MNRLTMGIKGIIAYRFYHPLSSPLLFSPLPLSSSSYSSLLFARAQLLSLGPPSLLFHRFAD